MPRDQSFVALGQFLQKQHQPLVVNQHAPADLDCTSMAKHIWFTIEKEPTQIKRAPGATNVTWNLLPIWGSFMFDFQFSSPDWKLWMIPANSGLRDRSYRFFHNVNRLWESANAHSISIRIRECGRFLCLVGEDGDWRELFSSSN